MNIIKKVILEFRMLGIYQAFGYIRKPYKTEKIIAIPSGELEFLFSLQPWSRA